MCSVVNYLVQSLRQIICFIEEETCEVGASDKAVNLVCPNKKIKSKQKVERK